MSENLPSQQSSRTGREPPKAAEPRRDFDYFIALDLGSESMAASFQHRGDSEPFAIDLQQRAEELLPTDPQKAPLDLMTEEDGSPSQQLRTRIGLVGRQPSPLPSSHADLSISQLETDSVFEFFHREGESLRKDLLPNPKLLFQTGVRNVIPRLKSTSSGRVQYEPAELLQNLTVQVLNNLVLNARELDHVIITVPNVYSLTHAKSLEAFVRRHVNVGAVDYMYESDATAHYMLGEVQRGEPDEVRGAKRRISELLSAESPIRS